MQLRIFLFQKDVIEDALRDWFYEGREKYHWSSSNFRNYWIYLNQFFTWCIQKGHLEKNPITAITKPKREKRLPRRLKYEDAEKLLYTTFNMPWKYSLESFRNHAIIATFLNTGLRAKELLDLKTEEVDLINNEIMIKEGKGKKDRMVFINAKLSRILRSYIQEIKKQKINNKYFFCSVRGNQLTYKNLWNMLRKVCRESKCRATMHQLRHTFASICIENGYNPYELQQVMGHSSFQTTEIYLQLTPVKAKANFLKMELF